VLRSSFLCLFFFAPHQYIDQYRETETCRTAEAPSRAIEIKVKTLSMIAYFGMYKTLSVHMYFQINILLHRETEEKARQPETKLGAIAHTRHKARLRNAKRSRTKNPKLTHRAQNRPKTPQSRAGQDRASGSG
jgi:hypothetical protein